jgi:hypothetical protein
MLALVTLAVVMYGILGGVGVVIMRRLCGATWRSSDAVGVVMLWPLLVLVLIVVGSVRVFDWVGSVFTRAWQRK